MERAVALASGTRVNLEDLPEEIRQVFPRPVAAMGMVRPLDEVEKEYILAALELNGGNQTHTAEQLHIGAATLYRKLKSYGMIAGKGEVRKGTKRGPDSSSLSCSADHIVMATVRTQDCPRCHRG
jgi:DNA-binding NtrC family response regulator